MFINFIMHVIIVAIASVAIPNFEIDGILPVIIFVIVLGLVNLLVLPIIRLLTMPVNFLTLGLLNLIINVLAIIVVAYSIAGITFTGSRIESFMAAGILALVISLSNYLLSKKN